MAKSVEHARRADAEVGLGTGFGPTTSLFPRVPEIVERMSKASPRDVQSIAGAQIELLASYYGTVLEQARRSFAWALIAAGVGLAFLLVAIVVLLSQSSVQIAVVSAIAGVVVEAISGLNFYLYGQTTKQLARYHVSLDRTQRFLLANCVCESLEGDEGQKARADLVKLIASQDDLTKVSESERT